jgi:hypothetical protein
MSIPGTSRRDFFRGAGALAVGAPIASSLTGRAAARGPDRPAPKRLKFSAMVTLGDWAATHGVWGEPGVYYILRRMKDAGFRRVYWRTMDGCGQACFPSRATNAAQQFIRDEKRFPEQSAIRTFLDQAKPGKDQWLQGSADFSRFDSVREGLYWARKLGLEFYCWHEHAEDHGGVGQIGRVGLAHPEWFTRNRDGKVSNCRFSWAIRPAMDYRLALVREVLEHRPDGIFFDFVKSMVSTPGVGCTPHFDDNGVWYCTYDGPAVKEFKGKTGRDPLKIPNDDPEWVRFRAAYVTDFLRRVRAVQRRDFPKVKVGLFGCPRGRIGLTVSDRNKPLADPLRAYLEDHETWTREGLLDEFVGAYDAGQTFFDSGKIKALVSDSRSRVHAPCPYQGAQMEVYGMRNANALFGAVEAVAQSHCEEVVFFETTPIEDHGMWKAAGDAIKRFGG